MSTFFQPPRDLYEIGQCALGQLIQRLRRILAACVLVATNQVEQYDWQNGLALTCKNIVEFGAQRVQSNPEERREIFKLDRAWIVFLKISLSIVETIHRFQETVQASRATRTGTHSELDFLADAVVADCMVQNGQSPFDVWKRCFLITTSICDRSEKEEIALCFAFS